MATVDNYLMRLIPRTERVALLADCEKTVLTLSEVLWEQGKATPYVYFPVQGFISLIAMVDKHPGLEVGMVGQEGMLGAHMALSIVKAPVRAVVQGQGWAWRLPDRFVAGVLSLYLLLATNWPLWIELARIGGAPSLCMRSIATMAVLVGFGTAAMLALTA